MAIEVQNNYAAAFTEFVRGTPVDEIAQVFGINESALRTRINVQRWNALALKMREELAVMERVESGGEIVSGERGGATPDRVEAKARVIQENREKNFRLWDMLRADATRIIETMVNEPGGQKFIKYFHNRGQIVEHTCDMSMAERTGLANYLQVIALGTYQALGDKATIQGDSKDGMTLNPGHAPAITIVLPGAIASPREARVIDIGPGIRVETSAPMPEMLPETT